MTTDVPQSRGWIAAVPNVMSGIRLLLALVFPFLPPVSWPWVIAAGGLTDLIDGQVARRFHVTSWVGGLLDGIADKAFVVSVLVTFTIDGRLGAVWLAVLLSRDVTVGLIAAYAAAMRQWSAFHHMPARLLGKTTTAVMFPLLVVMAIWPDTTGAQVLAGVVVGLSACAAVDYLIVFVRAESKRRRARA